jgi:phosphatidylinositol glycan class M
MLNYGLHWMKLRWVLHLHGQLRTILIFVAAAILRIVLIVYSVWHDSNPSNSVKYTDVDYKVFSDAAHFIYTGGAQSSAHGSSALDAASSFEYQLRSQAEGPLTKYMGWKIGDPYSRDTYRYTPLLALWLLPNEFLDPSFGKLLFAFSDLLIGLILYRLLSRSRSINRTQADFLIGGIWLLNPMVANISTRGSSEAVLGVMVLGCLWLVENGRWDWGAVIFGLAVHWKIYPVVYAASILARLWVEEDDEAPKAKRTGERKRDVSRPRRRWGWPKGGRLFGLITFRQVKFGVISFGVFMLCNLCMFLM